MLRSSLRNLNKFKNINITTEQKDIIDKLIRVDHAGELGANCIYAGQMYATKKAGPGRSDEIELVQHMWDQEKHHLSTFNKLIDDFRVRPTVLSPVWIAAGWFMGASTTALGKQSAMACTEAVETVIGEHYDDQITQLKKFEHLHPDLVKLTETCEQFRDDELEHLDTAVDHGAQQAPAHALLSAVIGSACKFGVWAAEKV
ncbi:ubiquinone biosynthesis protein COQ7 [Wallemia mellicola]|nr:ubiquinone biosynthesis protein COQ7 [Wallemia mellicola]